MNVLCTDKTGTLTEATIKLVRTIDGHGADSERAYAYAYVNSRFGSGMKSPLDEAILAAHPFDMAGWRRSTKCRSISSGGVSQSWSSTTPGVA
jgi:Mg2+-importing ATPase